MPKITFIQPDGRTQTVEVAPGWSVMEGAVRNLVRGIDADCGGACACATCHVYVDPSWSAALPAKSDMEEAMLDFAQGVQPTSRLSCQLRVTTDLDGLVVRVPDSQR